MQYSGAGNGRQKDDKTLAIALGITLPILALLIILLLIFLWIRKMCCFARTFFFWLFVFFSTWLEGFVRFYSVFYVMLFLWQAKRRLWWSCACATLFSLKIGFNSVYDIIYNSLFAVIFWVSCGCQLVKSCNSVWDFDVFILPVFCILSLWIIENYPKISLLTCKLDVKIYFGKVCVCLRMRPWEVQFLDYFFEGNLNGFEVLILRRDLNER